MLVTGESFIIVKILFGECRIEEKKKKKRHVKLVILVDLYFKKKIKY